MTSITFRTIERNNHLRLRDTVYINDQVFDLDLPVLTGDDKEIARAKKIRADLITTALTAEVVTHPLRKKRFLSIAEHDQLVNDVNIGCGKVAAVIGNATTAKFWISMREAELVTILRRLVAEHGEPA